MSGNSNLVKWIGKDGGWKVGKRVVVDSQLIHKVVRQEQPNPYGGRHSVYVGEAILIQHSHTGELEWVDASKLEYYPTRTERGEEPYGSYERAKGCDSCPVETGSRG